jgi:hypothetical protein
MKYEPIKNQSEDFIKNLAKDIFNNKVFTSFMIPEKEISTISMVFMPLMFMHPNHPHTTDVDTAKLRENKIWEILEEDDEIIKYKSLLPSIGMIYEYYVDENGNNNTFPRGINGLPMFGSMRLLNLEDTEKLRIFYNQYSKIRQEADNF